MAIGRDFLEAHAEIHVERFAHGGADGVEAHLAVADAAGLGDDGVREGAAEATAAKFFAEIHALHFADFAIEAAERDAACGLSFAGGDEEFSGGRSVIAGEIGDFAIEIEVGEFEFPRFPIFEEEAADFGDGRRGFSGGDRELGSGVHGATHCRT